MSLAKFETPIPVNEPIRSYAPGSPERASLKAEFARQAELEVDAPMFIGGKEVSTGDLFEIRAPHRHAQILGRAHQGSVEHLHQAIDAANAARRSWANTAWEDRAAIFLKAADLIAGSRRDLLNAATMHNQSKNCFQAEIDAACELIDFLRFNVKFAEEVHAEQPLSVSGMWNRCEYRALDGYVLAVTPFNFTAIAGNLPATPALMGNTVVWKPSDKAYLSAHYLMEIFREAGLPDGVINLVYGDPETLVGAGIDHPTLAGLHFTGSAAVFRALWARVGANIERYSCFPRVVGEAGGKDFIFAHHTADPIQVATAFARGAFEYQGQKCSAASRGYVAKSIWPQVKEALASQVAEMKVGPVDDFSNFVNAVICESAFDRVAGAIDEAKASSNYTLVAGGDHDKTEGYFIHPTVFESADPKARLMEEELFGPCLGIHVYDDEKFAETLKICDETSPYALTGAIMARDRGAVSQAEEALRYAAGNFYINDKCTGSVVGQQPFGGSRLSGTNDKAGSKLNLLRWTSVRSIKETFDAPRHFGYAFHQEA